MQSRIALSSAARIVISNTPAPAYGLARIAGVTTAEMNGALDGIIRLGVVKATRGGYRSLYRWDVDDLQTPAVVAAIAAGRFAPRLPWGA
jgi:hypothetical protein